MKKIILKFSEFYEIRYFRILVQENFNEILEMCLHINTR